MKFGRNYHKHQLPEWADAYIDYATLKRLCKESTATVTLQEVATRCIDALKTVDQFYCHNYHALSVKLSFINRWRHPDLDSHVGFTAHFDCDGLDYVELERTKAALKELVAEFDKLRWYGRVNADAFHKIIRKIRSLGSKGDHVALQVEEGLCNLDFATQAQCLESLENLHKVIAVISRAQQNLPKGPPKARDRFFTRLAKFNPSIPALRFWRAVEDDDSLELGRLIDNTCKGALAFSSTEFLYVLFQCSIPSCQRSWVDVLLSRAVAHDAVSVIESSLRNIIAEFHSSSGKSQQVDPSVSSAALSLLTCMLDRLLARKLNLLYKRDHLGRIPLHYACEGDSPEPCGTILRSMKAWDQLDVGEIKAAILLKDLQSRSPLQISVFGGHLEVTDTLIRFEARNTRGNFAALRFCFGELLLFAVKSNFAKAVTCLLNFNADVDCSDALGQTPLYFAARSGNEKLVRLLLRYTPDIDRPEITRNWTPLIVASLAGLTTIAGFLLEHGANVEHRDHAGWTAIDHASYRGHILLAKALFEATADLSHKQATELQHQLKTASKRKLPTRGQPRRTVSTTKSCVLVNLGSLDSPSPAPALCLSPHVMKMPSILQPQSLFSLGISMVGSTNPTYTVPLPLLEDATNRPWTFTIVDPLNAKLVFEVSRSKLGTTKGRDLVGRGLALLDDIYQRSHARKRESLSRDFTVPMLSTTGLEYIGTVTFSFVISTPLVLPETPPIDTEVLWFENGPSKVVGHRGSGQNVLPATRLQIGENTIESYLSAVRLGASYVELGKLIFKQLTYVADFPDVQLTKDHIPVVHHDFLVSETGFSSPMYTITHEQFMQINSEQSDQRLCAVACEEETEHFKRAISRKARTLTGNASDNIGSKAFKARIEHILDYKSSGWEGNTRGKFIHDAFVTLQQLLEKLPLNIALNIEIKYPMLSEATIDWNMDPFFVEANLFTDTILLCLAEHISTRAVLLSSFSPEICILLARKQSRWPVVFLTDSGNSTQSDVRATNLQEAVSFAKRWELDGVVLASEPFVLAPRLVQFVKGKRMVCATYGALNDDVEGATIQAMAGVDILIVNNVRLVSETLAAGRHKQHGVWLAMQETGDAAALSFTR